MTADADSSLGERFPLRRHPPHLRLPLDLHRCHGVGVTSDCGKEEHTDAKGPATFDWHVEPSSRNGPRPSPPLLGADASGSDLARAGCNWWMRVMNYPLLAINAPGIPHYEKVAKLFNGPDAAYPRGILMNMVVCASKVDPLGVLVALVGLSCCVFGRSSAARGTQLRRRAVLLPRLQPRRKRRLRLDGVQAQPQRPLSTASATTSLGELHLPPAHLLRLLSGTWPWLY